jgi:hypothetical protein
MALFDCFVILGCGCGCGCDWLFRDQLKVILIGTGSSALGAASHNVVSNIHIRT